MCIKDPEEKTLKDSILNFLRRLDERWMIKSFLLFIPTIWFSFITFWGKNAHLINPAGKPTDFCTFLSITICILGLLIVMSSSFVTSKSNDKSQLKRKLESETARAALGEEVVTAVRKILRKKTSILLEYIASSSNKFEHPFIDTARPKEQLQQISDEMTTCVHKITKIKANDIVISIAYCFDKINDEWEWLDRAVIRSELDINDLIKNKKSTIYEIYSKNKEFVFYNSKQDAYQKKHYLKDRCDQDGKDGSILCKEVIIPMKRSPNASGIRVIVSISTYENRLSKSEDEQIIKRVEENLKTFVLEPFEESIKIEILKLYIKNMHDR